MQKHRTKSNPLNVRESWPGWVLQGLCFKQLAVDVNISLRGCSRTVKITKKLESQNMHDVIHIVSYCPGIVFGCFPAVHANKTVRTREFCLSRTPLFAARPNSLFTTVKTFPTVFVMTDGRQYLSSEIPGTSFELKMTNIRL